MSGDGSRQMALVRLLAAGPCLTTAEMVEATGMTRNMVSDACVRLVRRGWVDRLERGCFVLSPEGRRAHAAGEVISSAPGPTLTQAARRPRRRTFRDRVWKAIRIARKFDLGRIEELAGVEAAAIGRYVRALTRVGYLSELRRQPGDAPTSNGFKRWLLVEDPGPETPVLKTDGRVWDPNRREFREGAR